MIASGQESPRRAEPRRTLSRDQRLRNSRQIKEAFEQQHKWVARTMVLWTRQGDDAALRLAVITSKKVGNAVARNRARRILREVWRAHRHRMQGAYDVVLIARRTILRAQREDIVRDMLNLTRKAGLYRGDPA